MAHAQRLTEQVKTMSAQIKQLETALADAQIGPLPLAALGDGPTVSKDSEGSDVNHEGDLDNMSKGLGSLAIDGEGKAQYYGETAGAEVRFPSPDLSLSRLLIPCFPFFLFENQFLQHLMPAVCPRLLKSRSDHPEQVFWLGCRHKQCMHNPATEVSGLAQRNLGTRSRVSVRDSRSWAYDRRLY
jgi:hypothetical protein